MKSRRENFLSSLDKTLRWTGIPARVAEDMSAAEPADRKNRPQRWTPIWLIACTCALFILSLVWQSSALDVVWLSLGVVIVAALPAIHKNGPLGIPSIDDDEREAALRKDSYLFCFGLLACLNCLGQPFLMIVSHLQHWQLGHSAIVAGWGLMLNAALFGGLPTLYASWNSPRLPKE
jgi:hypothetical protein